MKPAMKFDDNDTSEERTIVESESTEGQNAVSIPAEDNINIKTTIENITNLSFPPSPIEPVKLLIKQPYHRDFGFLPIPKSLQWDPENPAEFTLLLNIIFGLCSTFTVANLYYVQPILIVLAQDFDVSNEAVVNIPTLIQAGYATGLLFITPLGDLVPRRPLLLLVVSICSVLTLILALVKNVHVWEVLSFFLGLFSITPQILLPLAGDLARPEKRAAALAVVLSGLLLGLLFGRVLAGVISEVGTVAEVYFMSSGLNVLVIILLYLTVPDYPAKNQGLTYFNILGSMLKFAVTEPVLIQACLIGGASSAVFASFWVTSTFLLGEVFYFNSLQIGLMALIGILGVGTAPFAGKLIDRLVPWSGTLLGIAILIIAQIIYITSAGISVASVGVVIFVLDIGQQLSQLANATRIFSINPNARARLNGVYIFSIFVGQLVGTSLGARVYLAGGYVKSGALCLGLLAWMLAILLIRGPHAKQYQWIGWNSNYTLRKVPPVKIVDEEKIEVDEEVKAIEQ